MANNRLIVQAGSTAGAILGSYDVFGSNDGAETVIVFDNTIANFQGDFARGGDTIKLADTATDFTVQLIGSNVKLTSTSDGVVAFIPIGLAGSTVQFETAPGVYSDSRTLIFSGGNVMLGSQVVTTTEAAVAPAAPAAPALAAGPAIESAGTDDHAAAKEALAALEAPTATALGGTDTAVVNFVVEQIDHGFFARNSMEAGMTNFVVNFA
jgi:hypothetical protein